MSAPRPRARPDTSLTGKVRQGLWWGVVGGFLQQVSSVLATIVLVRLLAPAEFGVVVAANVVVAMVGLFTYLGIRLALVRIPDLDDRTLWTLFWMSTSLGVLTSALCVAVAGLGADVMGQPGATPYLRVLGGVILVQTLGGVPRALLQRAMRFRALYTVELLAVLGQSVASVVGALNGMGAWSLVLGHAVHAALLVVGSWSLVRRMPRLVFDRRTAREQLAFGAGMWFNSSLVYLVRNADFWAVSRGLGASALGMYYVAYVLPNVLRQRVTWVTNEVLLPSFASMQQDRPRLRAVYQRSLRLHASVGMPAMTGLAAVSPVVVPLFFGERWTGAAAPMALVCLAAAVEFVTQPATNLLVALGRTRRLVTVQLGRALVLVPGVFLAADRAGVVAVAAVVLVSSVVTAVHAQLLATSELVDRRLAAVSATLPALLAAGAMAGLVHGVRLLLPPSVGPVWSLALLVAVGVVGYPLVHYAVAPRGSRHLYGELRLLALRRSAAARPAG